MMNHGKLPGGGKEMPFTGGILLDRTANVHLIRDETMLSSAVTCVGGQLFGSSSPAGYLLQIMGQVLLTGWQRSDGRDGDVIERTLVVREVYHCPYIGCDMLLSVPAMERDGFKAIDDLHGLRFPDPLQQRVLVVGRDRRQFPTLAGGLIHHPLIQEGVTFGDLMPYQVQDHPVHGAAILDQHEAAVRAQLSKGRSIYGG
jgi:hypothetical protein